MRKKRQMIVKAASEKPLTKTALAKQEGISRSSLYYQPIKSKKDWLLKNQIERVLSEHHSYGYRRVALELKINKKRTRRIMRLFSIKPYRRRGRKFRKSKDLGTVYPNLIQQLPFPDCHNIIWVSDFTHIPFHGKVVYLATIKDVFDRSVVGWSLLTTHSVQLIIGALIDAVEKYGRAAVLHSDQGSEYKSRGYGQFAESLGIQLSMSRKASPWENGYQESFYNQFKVDLGDPNRFRTLGELAAEIFLQIHYYNHLRIHSKLKMPPLKFSGRQTLTSNQLSVKL